MSFDLDRYGRPGSKCRIILGILLDGKPHWGQELREAEGAGWTWHQRITDLQKRGLRIESHNEKWRPDNWYQLDLASVAVTPQFPQERSNHEVRLVKQGNAPESTAKAVGIEEKRHATQETETQPGGSPAALRRVPELGGQRVQRLRLPDSQVQPVPVDALAGQGYAKAHEAGARSVARAKRGPGVGDFRRAPGGPLFSSEAGE